jgi:hypothetical protein
MPGVDLVVRCENGEGTTEDWQKLVDSGLAWKLQGFFGRTATRMIEAGLLTDPRKAPDRENLEEIPL